jgi:hypothetical protein
MLGVCIIFFFVDVGCLALGKRQNWLYSFGMRGLITDCLLLLIVFGWYLFRESGES